MASWAAFAAGPALAGPDTYPSKPVRVIVPQAAGGPADLRARQIAERLSRTMGQSVIVENRPGAGGTIGADAVAKAPADGYTLLYGTIGEQSIAPTFYPNLPYDPRKAFAPITQNSLVAPILVVHPGLGVRSLRDLTSLARAKPGQLTGGSYGNGTLSHLLLLQLNREAGVEIVHVPYRSAAAALIDLAAGNISMMFDFSHTAGAFIDAGRVVPVMVVGSQRIRALPNVPSATEAGLPGIKHRAWSGFLAPAATPKDIIRRLNTEIVKALRSPELMQAFSEGGGETVANTPEEFAAFITTEREELAELARATGAKLE